MFSTMCHTFWLEKRWRCLPILALALLEIALFCRFCSHWWRDERRPELPATLNGQGMILRGDGLGYYAWLRSMLIDADWSFDNEFDEYNVYGDCVVPPTVRTKIGLRVNVHSIGPACVWAPAVIATDWVLRNLWPGDPPWPTDGYSLPYQLAVGLTSLATSLLGLAFLYGICRLFATPGWAALSATFLAAGTTIVYYETFEVSMAHGMGTTAMAALIWYWLKTYGSLSSRRWLVVGILIGVASLMRWQLSIFALLPTGECALIGWRSLRHGSSVNLRRALAGLCLAGLSALIAFVPQITAWHAVFGSWLAVPHNLSHRWLTPNFRQVLIARDRSLFYWTPITFIALACLLLYGIVRAQNRQAVEAGDAVHFRRGPVALLAGAFILQIYLIAAVYGDGVFLGSAYGFRLLTESLVVLAPGIAMALANAPPVRARLLGAVCCLLVVWNFLLIEQHRHGLVPPEAGATLTTMLTNIPKLLKIH
jgi:hypothetical protein